jgi:hypothetical protein
VLTESGYVHRSEDVCYRVQLSLHLLSKAIVFCEDCTPFPRSRASQIYEKGAKQLGSALFLDE